jgi:sigma-E factor negative regulatory protein RseC
MIEELGTIVELKSKAVAAVICKKSTLCENCASVGLCQMGDDSRSMLVEALNPLGAQVGDRVRLVTSTRSFLQSSFILYIVPLIALIIGAVAGQQIGLSGMVGIDPNLLAALIGTACLVGSFLFIRFVSRAIPRETYMPRIIEIIREE